MSVFFSDDSFPCWTVFPALPTMHHGTAVDSGFDRHYLQNRFSKYIL